MLDLGNGAGAQQVLDQAEDFSGVHTYQRALCARGGHSIHVVTAGDTTFCAENQCLALGMDNPRHWRKARGTTGFTSDALLRVRRMIQGVIMVFTYYQRRA